MSNVISLKPTHFGIKARDAESLIAFYQKIFGFVITDQGTWDGALACFLSTSPDEHHQLLISSGRIDFDATTVFQHISFRVPTLDDLKAMHSRFVDLDLDTKVMTHGNAWSVYIRDPEGNNVEIYTSTPWYVAQPFGKLYDITEPTETIVEKTRKLVETEPSFKPMEEWSAEMRKVFA